MFVRKTHRIMCLPSFLLHRRIPLDSIRYFDPPVKPKLIRQFDYVDSLVQVNWLGRIARTQLEVSDGRIEGPMDDADHKGVPTRFASSQFENLCAFDGYVSFEKS